MKTEHLGTSSLPQFCTNKPVTATITSLALFSITSLATYATWKCVKQHYEQRQYFKAYCETQDEYDQQFLKFFTEYGVLVEGEALNPARLDLAEYVHMQKYLKPGFFGCLGQKAEYGTMLLSNSRKYSKKPLLFRRCYYELGYVLNEVLEFSFNSPETFREEHKKMMTRRWTLPFSQTDSSEFCKPDGSYTILVRTHPYGTVDYRKAQKILKPTNNLGQTEVLAFVLGEGSKLECHVQTKFTHMSHEGYSEKLKIENAIAYLQTVTKLMRIGPNGSYEFSPPEARS